MADFLAFVEGNVKIFAQRKVSERLERRKARLFSPNVGKEEKKKKKKELGDIIRGGGARFQIRSPSFTFLDLRVFCAQLLPIVVF